MRLHPVLLLPLALALVPPLARLWAGPPTAGDNPHGGLQLDCAQCHNPERWTPVKDTPGFKHQSTGYALQEAHTRVECRSCHRSLVFNQVGTECADCHRDPHHGELGFRCQLCHVPRSWTNREEMAVQHHRSRFPLLGVHARVDCDSCHRGQQPERYMTTATECGVCHLQSYLNARNPSHAAGGFSRLCQDCHTTNGWRPATGIDHNLTTFPLTGAHQSVSCSRCHVGGRFTGTPKDCWSCHQANYASTTNPNHASANFPHVCDSCHSTTAWRPASNIDHNLTRFPLTGAHQGVACTRCHVGGRYTGTPSDCYSCHQARYDATTNPNHRAGGFPTTCENCHSTSAWTPASFDHNRTRFPLTGAHRGLDCARCHQNGRYAGTPTDCYSCHQQDYNRTSNPNHQGAGFPTDCTSCHSTSAWRPATFDHDGRYFPIYSGRHRGTWSSCSDCHRSSGNYRAFECITCHAHDKGTTDSKHREVRNYSYQSSACYQCHPRGLGGD